MQFDPIRRSLTLLMLAGAAGAALAQDYPSKPIRLIVPYAPGGTVDIVSRAIANEAAKELGQQVLVDNRGGAGGNIGMGALAKSEADGYTIGVGAMSTNTVNPHIYPSMPFDPRKDFSPVSLLGASTVVLVVNAESPIRSVADLIAAARKAPGLPYATAGTLMTLAGESLALRGGVTLTRITYKGSGPALTDLLGGNVGVMFDNLTSSLPHIKSGKLRALAVANGKRSSLLPQVPTIAESGFPGFAVEPWFAIYGPAKLPAPIVHKLNVAFNRALGSPALQAQLEQAGFAPGGSTPEKLQALTIADLDRMAGIVVQAQLKAD